MHILALGSLVVHLYLGLKNYLYKQKTSKIDILEAVSRSTADARTKTKISQRLVSLTSNSLIVIAMHVLAITPVYVNGRDPRFVDKYPYYIWVYAQNLWCYPLLILTIVIVYSLKNPQIQMSFWRDLGSISCI
jgi:hypothetical protein